METIEMPSAGFYIDGFNLYHSLKSNEKTKHALWLDIKTLCGAVKAPSETLGGVVYFTALTPWNSSKQLRHQTFISALKSTGVEVVMGRFAKTLKVCPLCSKTHETFEEKETDVNIASRIIKDAVKGVHDTFYLMTGDSDQVPTMRTVRELAPGRQLVSVFSVNRHSADLKGVTDRTVQLGWNHFVRNQLPDPIVLGAGRELQCPPTWKAPAPQAPPSKPPNT